MPKEVYIIVGTLVLSKMDFIFNLIKGWVTKAETEKEKEVTVNSNIASIQKDLGKMEGKIDKMSADLNNLYRLVKDKE